MDDVARRVIVEDIMLESPPKLSNDLKNVKDAFLSTGLPSLPVVDSNDKVLGVIERKSLLRLL